MNEAQKETLNEVIQSIKFWIAEEDLDAVLADDMEEWINKIRSVMYGQEKIDRQS